MEITFNQLPEAVALLLDKIDSLEKRLLPLLTISKSEGEFLDINEAASFLKIPKNTLYAIACRREITTYKPGKKLFFSKEELTQWIKSGKKQSKTEIGSAAIKSVGSKMRRA